MYYEIIHSQRLYIKTLIRRFNNEVKKKLLKTYNADSYYHLYVFKGANALGSDLEI